MAVGCLMKACGLVPGMALADIGAGTGKLTGVLLARGLRVFAVEPNDAMRSSMEQSLAGTPGFVPIKAAAEETGLPDACVDAVTAAQAFHWFDREKFKAECRRILKPGGKAALVWNRRDLSDPLMAAYEQALQKNNGEHGKKVGDVDEAAYAQFFAEYQIYRLRSTQSFNFDGFVGRALSSSQAPLPGHPHHEPLLKRLRELFDRHQNNGQVTFIYQTEVVAGTV